MSDREARRRLLRPCPLREELTVRNMIDHLRIEHRRRVSRDVSMKELGLIWDYFHLAAAQPGKEI